MEENKDINDLKSSLESLKAAREAEYAKIRSELSATKYEHKTAMYKVASAIKYEAHVSSKHHSELQTQLSTLYSVNSIKQ